MPEASDDGSSELTGGATDDISCEGSSSGSDTDGAVDGSSRLLSGVSLVTIAGTNELSAVAEGCSDELSSPFLL